MKTEICIHVPAGYRCEMEERYGQHTPAPPPTDLVCSVSTAGTRRRTLHPATLRLTFSLFTLSPSSWTSEGGLAIFNVSSSASVFFSPLTVSLTSAFSCCKSCFIKSFFRSSCAWISSHLSKAPGIKSNYANRILMQGQRAKTCRGCSLLRLSMEESFLFLGCGRARFPGSGSRPQPPHSRGWGRQLAG